MFTKISKPKTKAQAMVEFALVLPILLVLVYGLLEAGRLLVIFASVNTASRQAVRYGSAIGLVDTNNDGTLDIPHYEDCAGITAAANRVAFISRFTNVNISYDAGLLPDGTPNPKSIPGGTTIDPDPANGNQCPTVPAETIVNGDRISVYVSAQYSPIIPFIPLQPLTVESSASRTIVGEIAIHVTAVPKGWDPASGEALAISLTIDTSTPTYTAAGQTITYTYTIKNIGTLPVSGPFSITDDKVSTSCAGASGTLAQGASTTCTGTYTTTATDVTNGSVTNIAKALATGATSNQATATVTFLPQPKIELLYITPTPSEAFATGVVITYTYTLKNTGNVPLSSFTVSDNIATSTTCASATSPLQPGETTSCTGTYTIQAADINRGYVTNVASISSGGTVSNTSSSFVLTTKLFLVEITTSPSSVNTVGQVVTFTYLLRNKGSVNITSINSLTGTNVQNTRCEGATLPHSLTLAPGASVTCTSTYTVQQSDLDSGTLAVTNAIATATASGGGTLTSNPRSASVSVQRTPLLGLTISATPNPALTLGQLVTYTYTLKNNGNVSLKNFTISDTPYGNLICANPTVLLAPGATRTCSPATPVTHQVSQIDLDNGSFKNEATAKGYTDDGVTLVQSELVTYFVFTIDHARIKLTLTAPATAIAGGQVTFTFTIKNTGNIDFPQPFKLTRVDTTGPALDLFGCIPTALKVGQSQQCLPSYIVPSNTSTIEAVWRAEIFDALNPTLLLSSSQASARVDVVIPTTCDPRHGNLNTSPFSFTIFNNNPAQSFTIANIQIYWNNETGQDIQGISLGGTQIWSGNEHSNPASFSTFTGNVTVGPSGFPQLAFTFKKAYVANGTERVLVTFAEAGCPILDTSNSGQVP